VRGQRHRLHLERPAVEQQRRPTREAADANWSMTPQAIPTYSFSARWQSFANGIASQAMP
jgi:hypothetical protein